MRSIPTRVLRANSGKRWLTKTAIASLMIIGGNAHAASQTWKAAGFTDGNWNVATNWVAGSVPGAASGSTNGDTATFNDAANTAVTIDSGRNIQSILFDTAAAGAFTFNGGPLTVTNGGSITINAAVTNTQIFNNNFLGSPNSGATAYSFLNNSSTPGAKLDIAGNITGQMTASTETFTFGGTNGGTVSGIIDNGVGGGIVSLTKSGAGTWSLTNANTYTGITTISGGTLALSGGNNRIATSGTVNFSAASTLDIGSTEQTLVNMTMATGISHTATVNGGGGKLTLNGSSFAIGGSSNITNTLNMSGQSEFVYNNSAGTFRVSGITNSTGNGGAGVVSMAAMKNTITALTFGLGNFNSSVNASVNSGIMNLGVDNTINSNTITIGGNRGAGTLRYLTGTNTLLTLRGSDESSRVGTMTLSDQGGPNTTGTVLGLVDLTSNVTGTSTLDAMVNNLIIGRNNRATGAGGNTLINTGTFTMGAGNLDATTIVLAQNTAGFTNGGTTSKTTGNLTVTGGTIKANNFFFADQNTSGTTGSALEANFNLNGGGNLYAATIAPGAGTGTHTATRNFNWNDGKIRNYNSSTDLAINAGLTLKLAATGTHTFNIDANRTGTIDAVLADATTGGTVVKDGAGKLVLTAANTLSGIATVLDGLLLANNTTGSAFGTASVVVNGGTLGGTGSFTSAATVNAGGTLAPGESVGTLTSLGLLTFNSDSVFQVEVDSLAGLADQMNSLGVTIDPASSITLTDIGLTPTALTLGTTFTLLNNTSSNDISGVFANLPDGGTIGDGTNFYTANYSGGTGNDLVLTVSAIPEPGIIMAIVMGGAGLCLLRRRRVQS